MSVAVGTAAIAPRSIIQAAKDSDHRTRPVVAAEFQLSRESDSSMDLVIKNYGLSIAWDLTVTFDWPVTLTHVWEGLDHLVREAHLSVTTAFEAGHLHEPVR